jgi:hypothetical protein
MNPSEYTPNEWNENNDFFRDEIQEYLNKERIFDTMRQHVDEGLRIGLLTQQTHNTIYTSIHNLEIDHTRWTIDQLNDVAIEFRDQNQQYLIERQHAIDNNTNQSESQRSTSFESMRNAANTGLRIGYHQQPEYTERISKINNMENSNRVFEPVVLTELVESMNNENRVWGRKLQRQYQRQHRFFNPRPMPQSAAELFGISNQTSDESN